MYVIYCVIWIVGKIKIFFPNILCLISYTYTSVCVNMHYCTSKKLRLTKQIFTCYHYKIKIIYKYIVDYTHNSTNLASNYSRTVLYKLAPSLSFKTCHKPSKTIVIVLSSVVPDPINSYQFRATYSMYIVHTVLYDVRVYVYIATDGAGAASIRLLRPEMTAPSLSPSH